MNRKASKTKLKIYISIVIISLNIITLFSAHYHLTKVVNSAQLIFFNEKLNAIESAIKLDIARLEKTGMVEVYIDEFKKRTIAKLEKTYYSYENSAVFPVILDNSGNFLMHGGRKGESCATLFNKINKINKINKMENNNFEFLNKSGVKKWIVTRDIVAWNWTVAYTVPNDVKYGARNRFLTSLFFTTTPLSIVAIFLLFLIINAQFTSAQFISDENKNDITTL